MPCSCNILILLIVASLSLWFIQTNRLMKERRPLRARRISDIRFDDGFERLFCELSRYKYLLLHIFDSPEETSVSINSGVCSPSPSKLRVHKRVSESARGRMRSLTSSQRIKKMITIPLLYTRLDSRVEVILAKLDRTNIKQFNEGLGISFLPSFAPWFSE